MASRPTIFLSYTRRDRSGVEAADALESWLKAEGFDVWRDKNRLEAGYSWAPEIEREVERRDVMLAVISPSYRDSDICRAEHVLALRAKRRVIPLLVAPDAPIPLHLINKQYLNINEFAGVLHALGSDDTAALKPEYLKRRSNVSDRRPERFVPRPEELDALKRLILSEDSSRTTSIVGVRGQGGIGKTVLAAELARSRAIEAAFPDGIVWLPIGREPRELPKFLQEAARILGDGSGDYTTELAAYNSFRECVRDKAALLVLDDIWDARHVRPFLPLEDADAPRLRLVCTTRKPSVTASLRAREYLLGTLPPPLARQLLAEWLNCTATDLPPRAQIIIDHCHGHALALRLIGSLLAQKIRNWGPEEGWDYVLQWLTRLPFDPELKSVMETSLAALPDETARERYLDLAVFPDDTPIPFSVLPVYWQTTKFDAQDTVDAWLDLSLVEKSKDNRLVLHDLQLDYVKARRESPALHGKLVDAATNDDYFLAWLPYHLKHAGREAELEALLMDPNWLRKKLKRLGTTAVRADFGYASSEACSILARTLDLSSHVLSSDLDQLAFQFYGRLLDQPNAEIRNLLHVLEPELALRPLRRCLDAPGPIERRLIGHLGFVVSVAITADGLRAVSASYDRTLIVWDVNTGQIVRRLEGHSGIVGSVAITPDGKRAVSGSDDRTLIVWDLDTGEIQHRLQGHSGGVKCVALTPDGTRAISGSEDKTVIVWDLTRSLIDRRIEGHSDPVSSVALTVDGTRGFSWSGDALIISNIQTGKMEHRLPSSVWAVAMNSEGPAVGLWWDKEAKIMRQLHLADLARQVEESWRWVSSAALISAGLKAVLGYANKTVFVTDLNTGQIERRLKGQSASVTSAAVTPDGSRAISGSLDCTLIVWKLSTSSTVREPEAQSDSILSLGVTTDGKTAICGSHDGEVIAWNLNAERIERHLRGHTAWVSSIAITPDGTRAISSSGDRSLIVWNLDSGSADYHLEGHSDAVNSVALTPDGRRAISGSRDTGVLIWDLTTGKAEGRFDGHSSWVEKVVVTPDGSMAVSASKRETLVWELSTRTVIRRLDCQANEVHSLAILDDKRLITVSFHAIAICNLTSGRIERNLESHSNWMRPVAITSDRAWVVVGGGELTLWNLVDDRRVSTFTLDAPVRALDVSRSDPNRIVAGDERGRVHCFRISQ